MQARVVSGGRYDYLFVWASDLGELARRRHHLQKMSERLADLPYAREAARDTALLLARVDGLTADAAQHGQALEEVWHAVEWWDSGDSGEGVVREAAARYREAQESPRPAGEETERDLAEARAALERVRAVRDDLRDITGARAWAELLDTALGPYADAGDQPAALAGQAKGQSDD